MFSGLIIYGLLCLCVIALLVANKSLRSELRDIRLEIELLEKENYLLNDIFAKELR